MPARPRTWLAIFMQSCSYTLVSSCTGKNLLKLPCKGDTLPSHLQCCIQIARLLHCCAAVAEFCWFVFSARITRPRASLPASLNHACLPAPCQPGCLPPCPPPCPPLCPLPSLFVCVCVYGALTSYCPLHFVTAVAALTAFSTKKCVCVCVRARVCACACVSTSPADPPTFP